MGRELPQNKEKGVKNVDKLIAEVMRFENLKTREEVFAVYPNLAQWWAQEQKAYGEEQAKFNVAAGRHDC